MKYPKDFYTSARKKTGSKKSAKTKSEKAPVTAARIAANPPGDPSYCDRITGGVDNYLARKCEEKANAMTPVGEAGACPCSGDETGGSASGGVDLIVLIDASGSMRNAGRIIQDVAPAAYEIAKESCGAVANVTYLYCDGNDRGIESGPMRVGNPPTPSTLFIQSHETHLVTNAGTTGPFASDGDRLYGHEQGGKAISDLCNLNNWTPGHCRAILYISDEYLDSIDSRTEPSSRAAADIAIAAANANNVTLFTHYIGPNRPAIEAHYQDMADQTGGVAETDLSTAPVREETYIRLISRAICEGCGNSEPSCTTAEIPELEPCVSISWGDSECDCMEGDDHEEICITICNCYDNVTFQNVRIAGIVITDEDGRRPPSLPDGSPSSELYSFGPYCFGDIDPCKDGEKSCVSRNAMIINRGLPPGTWKVRVVGLCFDVTHHYDERAQEFEFTVCKN